jgi:hypothetical protein
MDWIQRVYVEHYNTHRPHRALGLQPPDPAVEPALRSKDPPAQVHRRDLSPDSCTSTDELHERICAPYVPRASFALMLALLPMLGTIIGAVVLRQLPTGQDLLGIALVVAGVARHRVPARGQGQDKVDA